MIGFTAYLMVGGPLYVEVMLPSILVFYEGVWVLVWSFGDLELHGHFDILSSV